MPAITSATITAFYLFDVAEGIDLTKLRAAIGGGAINARLTTKSAAPSYLQYATPPVVVDGEALDIADVDGFKLRVKFYDYGVLSLALTRPFAGDWPTLLGLSQIYVENVELERRAEKVARKITERFATVMTAGRATFLSEDYLVVAVTAFATPTTADDLVAARTEEIATLVRGERQKLSRQEQDEIMKNRLSYLADDLVVPTWNAAFVYDTEAGVQAALEIFEFANSQLLEFRYYDQLLDDELGRIYHQLETAAALLVPGARLRRRDVTPARPLHRRQRDHRSHREHAQDVRRHLFGAPVPPDGRAPRPCELEAKRQGKTGDARRHLSLCRRAAGRVSRSLPRDHHHSYPGARAGALLPRDHDVDADSANHADGILRITQTRIPRITQTRIPRITQTRIPRITCPRHENIQAHTATAAIAATTSPTSAAGTA